MADSEHWKGRRVLVTGCTGLLGTAVVRELLERRAEVVGLVRDRVADGDFQRDLRFRQVRLIHGLVEDRFRIQSALAVNEIHCVFHLATPTDDAMLDRGTAAVLAAVQSHDARIPVVTAQPQARLGIANVNEAEPAKHCVTWGVAEFGELFGGGDRKTFRTVPATILANLTGERSPTAMVNGSPRDFVFAPDAARACLMLAESLAGSGQPVSSKIVFQTGWRFTDRELAAILRGMLTGTPAATPLFSMPPFNSLGWVPAVSLIEAMRQTIDWYREFLQNRFFGTRTAASSRRAA